MLFRDSQNNISEAWEFNNFYKIKPPPCSNISEALEHSNKSWFMRVQLKGVYRKDDCGKLKNQRLKSYKMLQEKHISCGE